VQTTLLGLAIALILALFAALVGPFVIDWNQFRGPFEAEATRLLGAPVRVAGPLDARLLPTPSLRLRDVTVGGANDPGRVRADKLDVEFSLGSLMRGELRADELSINGVSLDLGLDGSGRLDWPAAGLSNLAALTVDRLNLTGRIALHDAASRSTVELSDIAFSGELRAQAAALRGDGNFVIGGSRYPFRLSTGQTAGGAGTRLRLSLNQGAGGSAAELDGVVEIDDRTPRFEGTALLAALAPAAGEPARPPWRLTAKLKADPTAAKLESLEVSWGAEDRALKLVGKGELRLGAAPRLEATLSARQLDADRLLAKDADAAQPARWLPRLRDLAASLPIPPLPARIALDADQIMLGGRPVTDVDAELQAENGAWQIARLDLRAPGGSRLALSGGAAQDGTPGHFKGSLKLESADPDLFAAWLHGRAPPPPHPPQSLRIEGGVSVSDDGVVLDPLKVAAGTGTLNGRFAYRARSGDRGSRLEAALKGDKADLSMLIDLARTLAGAERKPEQPWPDQAEIALEFADATAGDRTFRPLLARFAYDAATARVDRLELGSASGVVLEGRGTLDRTNATGKLDLTARAPSLRPIAEAIDPIAPAVAARLKAIGDAPGDARAKLALSLDQAGAKRGQVIAAAALSLDASQLNGTATLKASPKAADIRQFDFDALSHTEIALDGRIAAPRGEGLLALLGLDRALAAGEGAASLEASATGAWRAPLRLKAHLTAARLDAEATGTIEPWAAEPKAALALNARRLDLAPLLGLPVQDSAAASISATSQLAIAGRNWTFKDIDAGVAGSHLRGRIALALGDEPTIDGEAGIDTLALAPALQLALGAAGRDATDPLGRGWLGGWRGRLAFQVVRATLPGGSELQPLAGVLRSDGQSLTLDATGKLGGGDAKATITAKPTAAGIALDATIGLAGADGAGLKYGALAMPAGKVAVQATLASAGRSASALAGALSGGGTVTLDKAQIAGLDAKAFEIAIKAADEDQSIDDAHLAKIIDPVLSAGRLAVASAQFPFSLIDGRLRVAPTALQADAARAVISGGYDIAAGQADIRAAVTMSGLGQGVPPEIRIFAAGSPDRLERMVDLSALSSWLAIRRIDRETKKLQSLQQEAKPPPLIDVKPPANPHADQPPADPSPAQTSALPAVAPPASETGKELETGKALDAGKGNASTVKPVAPPLPDADPRRVVPKPRVQTPRPSTARPPPQASNAPSTTPSSAPPEKLAPLPPPLEIRPAPGDARPSRPRPPMVLSPPNNSRATF
jgi:uncharacterized protein involved in outer membrane biogenesis